jgi:hypothetical protein
MADSRGFVPVSSDCGGDFRGMARPGRAARGPTPPGRASRAPGSALRPGSLPPRLAHTARRPATLFKHDIQLRRDGVETDTAFQECNIRTVPLRNRGLGKQLLCLGLPKSQTPAADHRPQRASHHGHLTDPDKEPTMAIVCSFFCLAGSKTVAEQ